MHELQLDTTLALSLSRIRTHGDLTITIHNGIVDTVITIPFDTITLLKIMEMQDAGQEFSSHFGKGSTGLS